MTFFVKQAEYPWCAIDPVTFDPGSCDDVGLTGSKIAAGTHEIGLLDWLDTGADAAERRRRAWGRDADDLLDGSGRRPCAGPGLCGLWDLGIDDGGAQDLQNRFGLPAAADVLGIRLRRLEHVLDHAVEVTGTGSGDDDARCDAAETCVHTPNIGAYQGNDVDPSAAPAANTGFRADPRDRTPHVEDVDLFVPDGSGVAAGP